jgi:hypothetical protein
MDSELSEEPQAVEKEKDIIDEIMETVEGGNDKSTLVTPSPKKKDESKYSSKTTEGGKKQKVLSLDSTTFKEKLHINSSGIISPEDKDFWTKFVESGDFGSFKSSAAGSSSGIAVRKNPVTGLNELFIDEKFDSPGPGRWEAPGDNIAFILDTVREKDIDVVYSYGGGVKWFDIVKENAGADDIQYVGFDGQYGLNTDPSYVNLMTSEGWFNKSVSQTNKGNIYIGDVDPDINPLTHVEYRVRQGVNKGKKIWSDTGGKLVKRVRDEIGNISEQVEGTFTMPKTPEKRTKLTDELDTPITKTRTKTVLELDKEGRDARMAAKLASKERRKARNERVRARRKEKHERSKMYQDSGGFRKKGDTKDRSWWTSTKEYLGKSYGGGY